MFFASTPGRNAGCSSAVSYSLLQHLATEPVGKQKCKRLASMFFASTPGRNAAIGLDVLCFNNRQKWRMWLVTRASFTFASSDCVCWHAGILAIDHDVLCGSTGRQRATVCP